MFKWIEKIKQSLGLSPQQPSQPLKPVKSSKVVNKNLSGGKTVKNITNVKEEKSIQLENPKIDQPQKQQKPTVAQLLKAPITEQFTPSSREAFQQKLNALPDGSTIQLWPPKAEYPGPLVINHPITLDGQGATLWSQVGPVLLIQSQGVSLKNFRIEVTGEQQNNSQDQCAIFVKSGIDVKFDDIQVRGSVMGLPQEEGEWQYPECLNLGQLAYGTEYHFIVKISVPVSCNIFTDIAGLNLQPIQLSPGLNSIKLTFEKMLEDTLVSGNIFLVSASLKRRITVTAYIVSLAEDSTLAIPNSILWEPETGFSDISVQTLQEQLNQTEPEIIAFPDLPSFDSPSQTSVPPNLPEIQDLVEPEQTSSWSSSRIRRGEILQDGIFTAETNLSDAEAKNETELSSLKLPDVFTQSNNNDIQLNSTTQISLETKSSSLPSIFEEEQLKSKSIESIPNLSDSNVDKSKYINPLFGNNVRDLNPINQQILQNPDQENLQTPESANIDIENHQDYQVRRINSNKISPLFSNKENNEQDI